jgi:DNA-binding MarR family transcriptional regulator
MIRASSKDRFERRRTAARALTAEAAKRGRAETWISALLAVPASEAIVLVDLPPLEIGGPAQAEQACGRAKAAETHPFTSCAARELWIRAQRARFFDPALFGDAAWNILLLLYVLGSRQPQVSSTGFAKILGIPRSTALRWLNDLQDRGLVARAASPAGSSMHLVRLTAKARRSLDSYFALVRTPCS